LLDTGDNLRFFIYGHPNLSRLYTVDHQGMVSMPLIGDVPAEDVDALAQAMLDVLDRPGAAQPNAQRLRAAVGRRFTVGAMTDAVLELYASVMRPVMMGAS
jgi:glycosyltransferase involved in cell wall biosynthesis